MEFILSEKANRSGAEGFMFVRNKTHNDVTYWKCEEHLKCKNCVLSAAEEDSLMRALSEHSYFIRSYLGMQLLTTCRFV